VHFDVCSSPLPDCILHDQLLQGLMWGGKVYSGHYWGQLAADRQMPHGHGRFQFTGGHTHTGQWRRGTRHGPGRLEYPDGSAAEGEWVNGRRHGWFLRTGMDGRRRRLLYVDGHLERD
jgi:hypothetical protein